MTEEEGLCGGGSSPPDRGAQSTKRVSVTQDHVAVLVLLVHLTLTFSSSLVTLLLSSGDTWRSSGLPTVLFPGFLYSSLTGVLSFLTPPCTLHLQAWVWAVPSVWNILSTPLCLVWLSHTLITNRKTWSPLLCASTMQAARLEAF